MSKSSGVATAFVALALALALAAGPATAQEVVKIGVPISVTGALATEARLTADGYKFWADDVNRRGGLDVAGKKYKVELVIYDDQSSVDRSAQLTERLISQDKVSFLFSPYGSGPTYAASAVSERYHKLMLNGGGTAPAIFTRGFKYFFSAGSTTDIYPKGVFELVKKLNPKPKSIAILWKNDLANRAMNSRTEEFAKEAGVEVLYNKAFSAEATDFATELAVVRSLNPDIVFFMSGLPQLVTAIRQMKTQNMQPKMLWNGIAVPQPQFPANAGTDAEGILGVSYWLPSVHFKDPIWGDTAGFVKAFEAFAKYTPDYHAGVAAAGAELLELAIRKAGTLEIEAVRAALAGIKTEIFFGRIDFDKTGKNTVDMIIGQIQGGLFVPVYPPVAAQGSLRYPKVEWK